MKTIAFFNNKGGVGKTSLVYHLAWMYAELGVSVVAADLDPQSNLSSMLVGDDRIESLWGDEPRMCTIYGAMKPQLEGTGDLGPVHVEQVSPRLGAVVGDLALSSAEGELNSQWSKCLDREQRAFRVISLFWRVLEAAADQASARVVLLDVGPNLGAINRAALLAARHVVIPLAPDLYSLQGLRNLGPTIRQWRQDWHDRVQRNPVPSLSLPPGDMTPAGYVVMQHAVRLNYPVSAYDRWIARIPEVYRSAVLGEPTTDVSQAVQGAQGVREDDHCLALLKHYRSLMALAQEARKPMFLLRAADGAIGAQAAAVRTCRADFEALARAIAARCGVEI